MMHFSNNKWGKVKENNVLQRILRQATSADNSLMDYFYK